MTLQTIIVDALAVAGAFWPFASVVGNLLPAGKIKTLILSFVVDGKAVAAAVQSLEAGAAAIDLDKKK